MEKEHGTNWQKSPGVTEGKAPSPKREGGLDLNYFKEARLFLGKDRATLTFFHDNEVASIHFDMGRGEIFYRGHNVKNLNLSEEQWLSLQKFGDFLLAEAGAEALRQAYQYCLEQLVLLRWPRGGGNKPGNAD